MKNPDMLQWRAEVFYQQLTRFQFNLIKMKALNAKLVYNLGENRKLRKREKNAT